MAEVAEACGVSEKTVFNYFPIKESLVLDRLEDTVAALRNGLADPGRAPIEAARLILDRELSGVTDWLAGQDDPEPQIAARALLGLWHVHAESLRRHLRGAAAPARVHDLVTSDVRRAARLLDAGLRSFASDARG